MKNRFIFLLGIIFLIITIWFTTMAGIKANKQALENEMKFQVCKIID